MLNVIILTLKFSIAGKCFFLGSFIWRFSCGFLAVFLHFFGGEVNWRGGYAQTSFQIRAQRIFGAVPLGLQENAKGGEAWTQLACAQTSVHAPPTHSSASQEEAMPRKSIARI